MSITATNNVMLTHRQMSRHQFEFKGGKTAKLFVIESPHDTVEDTLFITSSLQSLPPKSNRVLFIEVGAPDQPDHSVHTLKNIALNHSDILEDFLRRANSRWTILQGQELLPFSVASCWFRERGGSVVNMDLSGNLTPQALSFMWEKACPEFALEHTYIGIMGACLSTKKTIPEIFRIIFPQLNSMLINRATDKLYEIYSDQDTEFPRRRDIHDYCNYIRERYMLETLMRMAKDDDIVLCHPNHAREITKSESETTAIPMPERLFDISCLE
ncbi:MAG: hypothetical protein WC624_04785 [Candidatus Margulisiibacteriota bacterium]